MERNGLGVFSGSTSQINLLYSFVYEKVASHLPAGES